MIGFKLEGTAELQKALKALPDAVSLRVQREALREGAEQIRSQAAAMAPRGDVAPHIADNIVIGIPSDSTIETFVSPDVGVVAIGPQKDFFYGFFWEFGTMKLPARPFMRPAFDTQARTALQIVGRRLGEAITKATIRVAKQAGLKSTRGQGTGGVGV